MKKYLLYMLCILVNSTYANNKFGLVYIEYNINYVIEIYENNLLIFKDIGYFDLGMFKVQSIETLYYKNFNNEDCIKLKLNLNENKYIILEKVNENTIIY